MVRNLESKNEKINELKLLTCNVNKANISLKNSNSKLNQLITLISQEESSRISTFFRVCLKQKLGTAAIIDKFQQALEIVVKTKSYTQKEYDVGLLVLRIAGSKVAKILYNYGVIPSKSTLFRVFKME